MNDSNEIRESLMKIKQSQADLLKQLRSEHDALQGYLTNNDIPFESNGRGLTSSSHRYEYPSYQSSLQLSKSEGYAPLNTTKLAYKSTTVGAEDILENNYKKIQELLVKQRKMYEQNHALQQQNQSLLEDYRELKKLFYELKQINRDNLVIGDYLLNDILYTNIKDLLLEVPNNEIVAKTKKNWNRFKIEHPKLFTKSDNNQHFSEQSQKFLQKIFVLLDQDFKVSTIKTKQQQIDQLKQKVSQLINMNNQVAKNKQQIVINQQKRHTTLEVENSKLSQTVKILELKLLESKSQNLNKLKYLQTEILQKCKEMEQISKGLKQKDEEINKYKQNLYKGKIDQKSIGQQMQQFKKEVQNLKLKLAQKQAMFQNQIQLNKKQNLLVERMSRDMMDLRSHIQGSALRRGELQSKLWQQNEGLIRQLTALKQDYEKYRQNSQRQINSLNAHNKQIKAQHGLLITSQENARVNEMRYRELAALKQANMKLTSNIDHLWSIKQIQYDNVMHALALLK